MVFKRGIQLGIEAKAWEKENLNIDKEQFQNLMKWEEISGITCYVGWRRNRENWYFVSLSLFKENNKSYAISWKTTIDLGKKLPEMLS